MAFYRAPLPRACKSTFQGSYGAIRTILETEGGWNISRGRRSPKETLFVSIVQTLMLRE